MKSQSSMRSSLTATITSVLPGLLILAIVTLSIVIAVSYYTGPDRGDRPLKLIPPPIVQGSPTGIFPQGSDVSMGSYNYTIPIEVPPGRAGLEPGLALSYNSDSTWGNMGYVGWNITGLSRIAVCQKILIRDKTVDSPNWNMDDNFCLDGMKLVELRRDDAESQMWHVPNDLTVPSGLSITGVYVLEDNSANVRVLAMKMANDVQPRTWVALHPDKTYKWYGRTEDSRMAGLQFSVGSGRKVAWLISDADHNFNRISYSYVDDPTNCHVSVPQNCDPNTSLGVHQAGRYIDEIRYTKWIGSPSNLYGDASTLRKIKFNWRQTVTGNRRDHWLNGIRMYYTQVLASVDVYGPSTSLVRSYRMYNVSAPTDPSPVSQRTLREQLYSITVCDASNTCLPETSFKYTTSHNPDSDIVEYMSAYEFPLSSDVQNEPASFQAADVTHDGYDDILAQSELMRSSGKLDGATYNNKKGIGPHNVTNNKVFDFDLDRKLEFMQVEATFEPSINSWKTPIKFKFYEFRENLSDLIEEGFDLTVSEAGVIPANVHVDLDGDQKQELILFKKTEYNNQGFQFIYRLNIYSLEEDNNGHKQWVEGFRGWVPWNDTQQSPFGGGLAHDINGDGRTDFVFYRLVPGGNEASFLYVNDAGQLTVSDLGFNMHGVNFMDVNGDNLLDAVKLKHTTSGPSEFSIRMNTGDGFTNEVDYSADGPSLDTKFFHVQVADFNEDGRDDFLLSVIMAGMGSGIRSEIWLSNGSKFYSYGGNHDFPVDLLAYKFLPGNEHALAATEFPQWLYTGEFRGINIFDANGDGIVEIAAVSEGEDGDDTDYVIRLLSQKQSEAGVYADRMISVENGLGAIEKIEYSKLSGVHDACQNNDDDTMLNPRICIHNGIVVAKLTERVPYTTDRVTNYHYTGAQIDMHGRGFVGYQAIEERDDHSGYQTVSRYDLDARQLIPGENVFAYTFADQPSETEFSISEGGSRLYTEIQRTQRNYIRMHPSPGVYRVQIKQSSTELVMDKHPNELPWLIETTYSEFDSFGYPKVMNTSVDGGSRLKQTIQYKHDLGESLLGLSEKVKTAFYRPNTVGPAETRTTAYAYTSQGELERITIEPDSLVPGTHMEVYEERFHQYYPGGLLKNVTQTNFDDSLSRAFSLTWSPDGTFLAKTTNALGHVSEYQFVPEFGGLYTFQDPNGVTHLNQYDSFGRLAKEIDPDNSFVEYQYLYYDEVLPYAVRSTSSSGDFYEMAFNQQQQAVREVMANFDGSENTRWTDYDYYGNLYTTIDYPLNSDPVFTTYHYDEINQLKSVKHADGSEETFGYQGFREHTATDARGHQTRISLSRDGLPVQEERLDENNNVIRTVTTNYGAFHQIKNVLDGDSGEIFLSYDIRGRVTKYKHNDSGWYDYTWNPFDELTLQKRVLDPWDNGQPQNGQYEVTYYLYGPLGRVSEIKMQNSTSGQKSSYTYDGPGAIGLLTSTTRDGNGDEVPDVTVSYQYDNDGRVIGNTYTIESEQFTIGFDYDGEGRVAKIRYPKINGVTPSMSYKYGPNGFLKSLEDVNGKKHWEALEYDYGHLKETRKGDHIFRRYRYDPKTRLIDRIQTVVNSAIVHEKVFEYFSNNQIKRVANLSTFIGDNFEYDELGRLSSWRRISPSSDRTRTFEFDDALVGVLSSVQDEDNDGQPLARVEYGFHQDTPHGIHTQQHYNYPEGVQTPEKKLTHTFDSLGRETAILENDQYVTSVSQYNGFDLPTRLKHKGKSVRFVYDTNGSRVLEDVNDSPQRTFFVSDLYEKRVDDDNNVTHVLNLYTPEGRIGQLLYDGSTTDASVFYFEEDIKGSLDAVLNRDGEVVKRFYYSPYGIPIDEQGNEVIPDAKQPPYFAGHRLDVVSGRYNMYARHYDPQSRRFTTTDPVFTGLDSYAYVHNDPVNRIDPYGLCDNLGNDCYGQGPVGPGEGPGGTAGSTTTGGLPDYPVAGGKPPRGGAHRARGSTKPIKTVQRGPGQTPNLGHLRTRRPKSPPKHWDLKRMYGERSTSKYSYYHGFSPTGFWPKYQLSKRSGIKMRAIFGNTALLMSGWSTSDLTFEYLYGGRYGSGVQNIMADYIYRMITLPATIRNFPKKLAKLRGKGYPPTRTHRQGGQKKDKGYQGDVFRIQFIRNGKGLRGKDGNRKIREARRFLQRYFDESYDISRKRIMVSQFNSTFYGYAKDGTRVGLPMTVLWFKVPKGFKGIIPILP